jgi:hypothetical protein
MDCDLNPMMVLTNRSDMDNLDRSGQAIFKANSLKQLI